MVHIAGISDKAEEQVRKRQEEKGTRQGRSREEKKGKEREKIYKRDAESCIMELRKNNSHEHERRRPK